MFNSPTASPKLAESQFRPAVFFTAHSHQVLSTCAHLLGLSVLSCCLSYHTPSLRSWRQWSNITWARVSIMLVLLDSWLFVFFTGVLVNGVGLSYSDFTCALAIYACISFYVASKLLIYGFLVEKVYIVWSEGKRIPRFSTPAYRICSVMLLGYITILILMVMGRNSFIRADGICVIGLKNFATIPAIAYDLFLNIFLTAMFLWPLWRSKSLSRKLRNVATRTLCGATVSLITAAANGIILASLKGREYGWACLGSCVTDVALNAIALSWVTAGSYSRDTTTDTATAGGIQLNRFSLETTIAADLVGGGGGGPSTLVQNDCEMGKVVDQPEHHHMSSITSVNTTLRETPKPLLELESSHDDVLTSSQGRTVSKDLFRSLRMALSRSSDFATLPVAGDGAPTDDCVKPSSSPDKDADATTNPITPILNTWWTTPGDTDTNVKPPSQSQLAVLNQEQLQQLQHAHADSPRPISRKTDIIGKYAADIEGNAGKPDQKGQDRHGFGFGLGFIDHFRSLVSQIRGGNDTEDSFMEFVRPDSVIGGYESTTPTYHDRDHQRQLNYNNSYNSADPFSNPSSVLGYKTSSTSRRISCPPPPNHVRILNGIISCMPTIESCSSGENGTSGSESRSTHSSDFAGGSSGCGGDGSYTSRREEGEEESVHTPNVYCTTAFANASVNSIANGLGDAGSDASISQSDGLSSAQGSIGETYEAEMRDRHRRTRMSVAREEWETQDGVRKEYEDGDRWDDAEASRCSFEMGSPCESLTVSVGHPESPMEEEEAREGELPGSG